MNLSIYTIAIETFVPMLRSLSNILDKGAEHARAAKSDPAALVDARLAPDMYTLAQQVQLACDHAAGFDCTSYGSGAAEVREHRKDARRPQGTHRQDY